MKYAFIARHRSVWPTRMMCRVMAVSHSGFYEWLEQGTEPAQPGRRRLTGHPESFGTATAPTAPAGLARPAALGESCGDNRVTRLMHQAGCRPDPSGAGCRRQRESAGALIAAEPAGPGFEAAAPQPKWVADFTYIWTAEGWLYLAAVIDSVLAPRGGLVHERDHDRPAGHRRLDHGDLAARQAEGLCITPTRAASTRATTSSNCSRPRASPAA